MERSAKNTEKKKNVTIIHLIILWKLWKKLCKKMMFIKICYRGYKRALFTTCRHSSRTTGMTKMLLNLGWLDLKFLKALKGHQI